MSGYVLQVWSGAGWESETLGDRIVYPTADRAEEMAGRIGLVAELQVEDGADRAQPLREIRENELTGADGEGLWRAHEVDEDVDVTWRTDLTANDLHQPSPVAVLPVRR